MTTRLGIDMPQPVADLVDTECVRAMPHGFELIGSSCHRCGALAFPQRTRCQTCFADGLTDLALGRSGRLYSYSLVHLSSVRPVPYLIGYVDLPSSLRVLSYLDIEPELLGCDIDVVLSVDEDGWRFVVDTSAKSAGPHDV